MSLVIALAITIFVFFGFATFVSAENTVYIDEDFDSYSIGDLIVSGKGEAPSPVVRGEIIYEAVNREEGIYTKASIKASDDENKYLYVDSDEYATSNRGISFTFADEAGIPTTQQLGSTDVLELSMEVESTQKFELTGFGEIPVIAKAEATATIIPTESASSAVIVKAMYNNDMSLKSIAYDAVETVTANMPITVKAQAGTKVMLWNSIDGMKPLSDVVVSGFNSSDVSVSKSGMNVVRAIIDKANNKQYLIITNPGGEVLSSTMSNLTATGFIGATFFTDNAKVAIDNIKIEKKSADTGIVNISVKDKEDNPVADTTITIGKFICKTDANGTVTVALPNGEYTVVASKTDYEHTETKQDNDTKTFTVNSNTVNVDMLMSFKAYVKLIDEVKIGGGQDFVAAPKDTNFSTTRAFTTEVKDQYGNLMTDEEYSVQWSIYPHGSTTADSDVTIDSNGVVSVSQAFRTDNKIEAYDVTAVVFVGGRNKKVTKTIYVGNNDVICYEDVNWSQSGGAGNRFGSVSLANEITLADISSVTVNVTFPTGTEGQTTLALTSDGGNLAGIQLSAEGTVKVWSGWTGSSNLNQKSDKDKFESSGVLVENYTNDTTIDVTFVIDRTTDSIIASYKDKYVRLPFDVSAVKLTGFKFGQYRNYGALNVNTITVQELDNNYLAAN